MVKRMNSISYAEAAAFLAERDGFVVFTHANPDGDTIGSAAALVRILRAMGKNAVAVCADKIPQKLSFLDKDGIFANELPENIGTAVSVDVASKAVLGGLGDICDGEGFELSIDHHKVNTLPCKRLLVKPEYIANGEIIYELALFMGARLDFDIAEALYTAICSDSGGFRYSNTRPETYEYAAEFLRAGIDFADINRRLFEQKSETQIKLEREAYNALTVHYGGKLAVVAIDEETALKCGASDTDFDSVNQIPRQLCGVEVSAVIRPKKGETKVSLRSNVYYDVSAFAKRFGGGGHVHAAGYQYGGSVKDAAEALIKEMDGTF